MRFFIGHIPDNLILIPTLILSLGRCECDGKPAAGAIILSWFNVEIGLEIPFFS